MCGYVSVQASTPTSMQPLAAFVCMVGAIMHVHALMCPDADVVCLLGGVQLLRPGHTRLLCCAQVKVACAVLGCFGQAPAARRLKLGHKMWDETNVTKNDFSIFFRWVHLSPDQLSSAQLRSDQLRSGWISCTKWVNQDHNYEFMTFGSSYPSM